MEPRKLGFRLAAVVLGLLIGIVALEIGLQLTGTKPGVSKRMIYLPQGPFDRIPHPPFMAYQKDFEGEQIYFECTDEGCEENLKVPFKTNSMRMRDFAHVLEKPPGSYRVLVIGDSFSVADGVERMAAWPQALGVALDKEKPIKRVEVINASMQAYSTLDQWHTLQHAIRFEPDLILVGIYLNDAMPSTTNWSVRGLGEDEQATHWDRLQTQVGAIGPWLPPMSSEVRSQTPDAGIDHQHFLGNVRSRNRSDQPMAILQWTEALAEGRKQRTETIAAIRAWWGPWNKLGRLEFTWSISQLGQLSAKREIPIVAVVFPWMDGLSGTYPFDDIHAQIHGALDGANITYVDMLEPFQQAAAEGRTLWAHPTDHHPSAELHALTAETLLPLVKDR